MRTLIGLTALRRAPARAVVAIGMFDGVHLGHQRLIRTAVRLARRVRGTSVVMTFHPDPQRILRPQAAPDAVMPLEDRLRLIRELGVDAAWVIPFTRRFARYSAAEFAERILRRRLRPFAIVVGENFSFGKGRRGGIALLRHFGARHGIRVVVVPPVVRDGGAVSSSRIRALVERGRMEAAHRLLGRPLTLSGTVHHGDGRGRLLGFPTANLSAGGELMPARGVYRVRVRLQGRWRAGLMNVGVRPTFHRRAGPVLCEVYLPGVRGSLYGRRLDVEVLSRLRSERAFASPAALIRQIQRDLAHAGLPAAPLP